MVKKVLLFAAVLLSLFSLEAASVSYVYRNNISSIDFDEKPKKGILYSPGNGSLLITSGTAGDAVLFDKIYTAKQDIKAGDKLVKKGRAFHLGVEATLRNAFVRATLSTGLYPLNLTALCGTTFSGRPFAGAGLDVFVPLSLLFSTKFTLLEDASVNGWCTLGASFKPVEFSVLWGVTYRHFIKRFYWEVGVGNMNSVSQKNSLSPVFGLGVLL